MKRSPELLAQICDWYHQEGTYAAAARKAAITEPCLWNWINRSKAGDREFLISYAGEESIQFVDALKISRQLLVSNIVGNLEKKSLRGWDQVSTFKGQVVYLENEDAVGLSDDECKLLGIDRWKRDENGNRCPVMIHHEPSDNLLMFMAERLMAKTYGSTQTINVNSRTSGVTTIRHQGLPPPRLAPAQPQPAPALPAPAPAVNDLGLDDAPEPMVSEPAPQPIEEPKLEPEPQPKAVTPLQSDLLARLAALRSAPAAQPKPSAPVRRVPPSTVRSVDDVREGIGAGGPSPDSGAVKIG